MRNAVTEPVNLTNCDREPIHIPGSIQPHGCLLACDARAATVLRHSANSAEILHLDSGDLNGSSVDALIGASAGQAIREALVVSAGTGRPAVLFGLETSRGRYDVAAHSFKTAVTLEFEPAVDSSQALQTARQMIRRAGDVEDVDRLIAQAARLVRGVLGYDRVMIYRFENDGAGKVIAEVKRPDLESFLGQYFPSSDIPVQARTLYLRNTIRIISDASCVRVPIVPERDAYGEPLDLSYAHLRSVSPIHCEYLRNMGVAASMSISIIIDGALWGLIACHHYAPRTLPAALRAAAEMFGEFFSLHLHSLIQKRRLEAATAARRSIDRFLRLASYNREVDDLLRDSLSDFMQLLPCDGAALWMRGRWSAVGAAPTASEAPGLARFVNAAAEGRLWATHTLGKNYPDAETFQSGVAGLIAVPLSQIPGDYLFFFRKELVRTLDWAGNPEKSYETGPFGDRLTPRKSFAIWKEIVRNQAQQWTDDDRETAEAIRAALVEVVLRHNELMADERAKADVRQRMLNEELNHRVKNILAVIKSLIGHPVREGRTLGDYVTSLKGRIQALALAHDQVVRGDGGGDLAELMGAELSPYRDASGNVTLRGPGVWLDSRAFPVMALVLHELATNAAKYGVLSRPGGQLAIEWSLTPTGDCELFWREIGGPPVSPPSRQGFGSALIDRSIPYDLGGESSVDYARDGLTARFLLPARHVSAVDSAAKPSAPGASPTTPTGAFASGTVVLLVEDQILIAMDVEAMLEDHGVASVVTANSAADALSQLKTFTPDVAVLDVNLGDGTSAPVAEELKKRGVPFVFATGYGDRAIIPPAFQDAPMVRKPYDSGTLVAAMATLLER